MSTPDPALTEWVPLAGGSPSPSIALPDVNPVAGDQDLLWAGGSSIQAFVYMMPASGAAIRRWGAGPPGASLTIFVAGANSVTLRHDAASGTGDRLWFISGVDRVVYPGEVVTFYNDGKGYWLESAFYTHSPSYRTSLPTNPINGQECILVDSLTVPNYQWRVRYNALASGTNKWECIGGLSKTVQYWGSIGMGVTNTWTAIPTMPALTAPFAGTYEVMWGATLQAGSITAHITYIGLADGGYSNCIAGPAVPSNTVAYPVGQIYPEWGLAAAGAVQIGMKSAQAQSWSILNPWTSIMPKRIR
jgi:hypothetical protein